MTRPRIWGAAASWSVELTPAANITLAAPRGTSKAAATGSVGAAAATLATPPNANAAPVSIPGPIRERAPVTSAPATDPIPIATASAV